jgi:mxaK protein
MARKQRLTLLLTALALSCVAVLVHDILQRRQTEAFNAALQQQDWDQAARHGNRDGYGELAQAYGLSRQSEFEAAIKLLGTLQESEDDVLRNAAQFNLANAYMRWALSIDLDHDSDIALPLVELAKQGYRRLLQSNPRHWDAKYNLERALQLFPDIEEQAVQEWQAPENSPRSLATFRADRQLP